MRFLALDLRNFGPFRNAPPLDLSGGSRGLHLIVGPNEAGKSTALRAIRALLFDYPRSTPDDHGRDPAGLRLGARLRSETGAEVAFVRRKRGVRFWTPDDRSSLPDDPLPGVLDGLDEATFVDLFSTDHAELVRGGQAILAGGGKLGAMLFAAGSGLAQLEEVRAGLQEQLEGLFKSRNARLPAINKGLEDLKAARELVRQEALPTAEWVAAESDWQRATARRVEVARSRREAQADLDRRRGWLGALRLIPRRRDVLDRLAACGPGAELRPDFAEVYRTEMEAERQARRAIGDADAVIRGVEAALAELGDPDPILPLAGAVQRLHADLSRYAEARRDRPDLAAALDRLDERVATLRAELPDALAVPPGGLTTLRDPIQALAVEQARLLAQGREAEAELARHGGASVAADSDTAPATPEARRWAEALDAAIARAVAPGDLDARRREALARRLALAETAATSLRGLTLWSGSLVDLASLAIPPAATFDHADVRLGLADEARRLAESERAAVQRARLELDREAERAGLGGPVPTLADLDAGRHRRDALWRALRGDAEAGAPFDPDRADRFEAAQRATDDLADGLRHAADRVAAEAQRAVEYRHLDDRLRLAAEAHDRAEGDRRAAWDDWAGPWLTQGVEPLSPRAMRDWVRVDRAERLRHAEALRDLDEEVNQIAVRLDALRADLNRPLIGLGEPPIAPDESLAAALDRARGVVVRVGDRFRADAARARLVALAEEHAAWLDRWRAALAPIGLPPDSTPTAANLVVDRLGAWHDATREAQAARARLAALDAVEHQFAADLAALLDRLGGSAELPADLGFDRQQRVQVLADRLNQARAAQVRQATLRDQIRAEQARRAEAERALAQVTETLASLATEAGCARLADLPDAIRRAQAITEDRAELRRLDEQLDACAGTLTRVELLEAVAGRDEGILSAEIAELAEVLADRDAELAGLGEAIGAARERLDAMNLRRGAFGAQEELAILAARLEANVEAYARLRLASAVLRDAIERYRLRNQGPILERAGALFARLTAESFVGLQPDRNDRGEPILRGVRGARPSAPSDPTADRLPPPLLDVAAMSAGTADQLYLALRLASLSVHLDDHPPAPFVVDDILVQSDDDRARAALLALAELAERTQVLFFTHHEHLVGLARAVVPADALFIHRLDARAVVVPTSEPESAWLAPRSRRARSSTSADSPAR